MSDKKSDIETDPDDRKKKIKKYRKRNMYKFFVNECFSWNEINLYLYEQIFWKNISKDKSYLYLLQS